MRNGKAVSADLGNPSKQEVGKQLKRDDVEEQKRKLWSILDGAGAELLQLGIDFALLTFSSSLSHEDDATVATYVGSIPEEMGADMFGQYLAMRNPTPNASSSTVH
jgi:hypothetical protein